MLGNSEEEKLLYLQRQKWTVADTLYSYKQIQMKMHWKT